MLAGNADAENAIQRQRCSREISFFHALRANCKMAAARTADLWRRSLRIEPLVGRGAFSFEVTLLITLGTLSFMQIKVKATVIYHFRRVLCVNTGGRLVVY